MICPLMHTMLNVTAVYLCKRTMQNKTRLELADYEAENLARLQKMFSRKWEFIFMQAEAQSKVDKKRDKLERKVLDSQERAFWDVHRPMVIFTCIIWTVDKLWFLTHSHIYLNYILQPGCVNTTELDIKKACRSYKSVIQPSKHLQLGVAGGKISPSAESNATSSIEFLQKQIETLKDRLDRTVIKVSKVAEAYVDRIIYFKQNESKNFFLDGAFVYIIKIYN